MTKISPAKIIKYSEVEPFTTRDGSTIRELLHPNTANNVNQSLAEASIEPGQCTLLHKHLHSEEIYHLSRGTGLLTLGDETIEMKTGDSICIPPGTAHRIENTGSVTLIILCCCAPAYSHDDTTLL